MICDVHFSSHLKSKGDHQYEFIPSQTPQPSIKPPPPKLKSRNLEIQRLLDTLPSSTRQTLSKLSNANSTDLFMKPSTQFIPKSDCIDKIYYSENEFYEGEVENGKEHGSGKYTGLCEYEGEWRYGLPQGTGQLSFSNGKYHGSWYEGLIAGNGRLDLCNGDSYIGEFCDGKMQGNGKYMYSDGTQASGYFRDHYLVTQEFASNIPTKYLKSLEAFANTEIRIPERLSIQCRIFTTPLQSIIERDSSMICINFFKNNSFILVSVNFELCEKTEETVSCSHKLSGLAGVCEIRGMLMHVGGLIGEKPTGNCVLLNPTTKEIDWLEPCSKRSSPCAIYNENKVYVFGGSDHFLSFLTSSEIYDCSTHKWSPIAPLPAATDALSAGATGRYITLSGYLHTKLYVFDTVEGTYVENLELPDFREKVLCVEHGKSFLMCNKKLYESKTGNPFEWKVVRDIVYNSGWNYGFTAKKGKVFYWYTTDKDLWKFDSDTKGVFLIKKFK